MHDSLAAPQDNGIATAIPWITPSCRWGRYITIAPACKIPPRALSDEEEMTARLKQAPEAELDDSG
jgi:hypothetical protein